MYFEIDEKILNAVANGGLFVQLRSLRLLEQTQHINLFQDAVII